MMPRAPPIVAPPPVLRPIQQTLAWLASRWSKPPDLDLCPTLHHPPLSVLWCNRQTVACLVLRPRPRNCHSDFEVQITKPELLVLRPKPGNRRPWFWGSTKKHALLISMCTVQTAHDITRLPDRSDTKYPIYAWPFSVLCTSSPTPT
jgi:hypothetical protein